jgi:hypothetical protein
LRKEASGLIRLKFGAFNRAARVLAKSEAGGGWGRQSNCVTKLRATLEFNLNLVNHNFATSFSLGMMSKKSISDLLASSPLSLSRYEELYKYFHSNPELSSLEEKTAATVADWLRTFDTFEIYTNIGGHGLAAVFKNGPGQTIMLRADMDALPVEELTELPYASTKKMLDINGQEKHVMHACGHDMHMTCLLAGEPMVSSYYFDT